MCKYKALCPHFKDKTEVFTPTKPYNVDSTKTDEKQTANLG